MQVKRLSIAVNLKFSHKNIFLNNLYSVHGFEAKMALLFQKTNYCLQNFFAKMREERLFFQLKYRGLAEGWGKEYVHYMSVYE